MASITPAPGGSSSGGTGAVSSVAGKTGVVTLSKGDVGLDQIDNTADASKPVSTPQATAIGTKYTKPAGGIPASDIDTTSAALVFQRVSTVSPVKTSAYTATPGEVVLVDPTGRTLTDAIASSSTAMTSASGEFTAADVGRSISGPFIPAGTTIAAFTSANAVTLSVATTGTVNAANSLRKVNVEGSAPVTLPASAPVGSTVEVKNLGWGTGAATVLAAAGDNIDGSANVSWLGRNVSRRFVKASGSTWVVVGGLTPILGPSSAKYLTGLDLYLPSTSCLRRARAALAGARTSGTSIRVLEKGDSTTYGVLGGGGNGTNGIYNPAGYVVARDINSTERLRKQLNATNSLNGRVDLVYAGTTMDPTITGSRFAVSGGLTGNLSFTAAAHTLTMVDDQQANAWDITLTRTSGTVPTGATFAVDGAAAQAIDMSTVTASNTMFTIRITASTVAAHTVVITGPTAGGFNIWSITPLQTAAPALMQLRNGGVSGLTVAVAAGTSAINAGGTFWAEVTNWKPDLVRLLIGVNDMHLWTSGSGTPTQGAAAYKANLITFVTLSKAAGADVILGVFPSHAYAAQEPSAYEAYLYHQAIYEVADTYDCAVWDLQRRWGYGSAAMDYTSLKWPLYDGVHPTLAGYEDIARAEANLLTLIS